METLNFLNRYMDMEMGHLLWNLVLTGIIGPFVWFIINLINFYDLFSTIFNFVSSMFDNFEMGLPNFFKFPKGELYPSKW